MICLGIESTAHTFGVGIITDKGKVLANAIDSYKTEAGGLIPNELAKHHNEVKNKVLKDALEKAKIKLKDINLVSFSQGPGMQPALLVGLNFAKETASKLKVPLVGVNHCVSHLEIGKLLTKAADPVLLYASGANTQIIAYEAGKYRIFGETLDQGIGNFIDAFARYIGLGFPGGPKIEKLALQSNNYVELPYVVKGMDVSFSGILTNLKVKYDSKTQENRRFSGSKTKEIKDFRGFENKVFKQSERFFREYKVEDLCYSLQETVFAMLVEVSERSMAHTNKKELLLGGGVACNKRLQEMCNIMCKERNAKLFVPENQYLVDNATMIAWQGILQKKESTKDYNTMDIEPYQRTDDIIVTWKH